MNLLHPFAKLTPANAPTSQRLCPPRTARFFAAQSFATMSFAASVVAASALTLGLWLGPPTVAAAAEPTITSFQLCALMDKPPFDGGSLTLHGDSDSGCVWHRDESDHGQELWVVLWQHQTPEQLKQRRASYDEAFRPKPENDPPIMRFLPNETCDGGSQLLSYLPGQTPTKIEYFSCGHNFVEVQSVGAFETESEPKLVNLLLPMLRSH